MGFDQLLKSFLAKKKAPTLNLNISKSAPQQTVSRGADLSNLSKTSTSAIPPAPPKIDKPVVISTLAAPGSRPIVRKTSELTPQDKTTLAQNAAIKSTDSAMEANRPSTLVGDVAQAAPRLTASLAMSALGKKTPFTAGDPFSKMLVGTQPVQPMANQVEEHNRSAEAMADAIRPDLKGKTGFAATMGKLPFMGAAGLAFGGIKALDVDPGVGEAAGKTGAKVAETFGKEAAERLARDEAERLAANATGRLFEAVPKDLELQHAKEALVALQHPNVDIENGYQTYKRAVQSNPDLLSHDAEGLVDKLAKKGTTREQLEGRFFSGLGGGETTNDGLLTQFKDRLEKEKGIKEDIRTLSKRPSVPGQEAAFSESKPTLTGDEVLAKVKKIFTPEEQARRGLADRVKGFVSKVQESLTSQYTPLRNAEKEVAKLSGTAVPKLDMAKRFELVAGAGGKARADIETFANDVVSKIPKGSDGDFNSMLFLERTRQRLEADPSVKKVADWTPEEVQNGIDALQKKLGPERYQQMMEVATGPYQGEMDKALRLQVESGRMSGQVYDAIKQSNDFYAPFKVLKYMEEDAKGASKSVSTLTDLTHAITGIHDEDFKLQDMLQSSAQQIYQSRVLAEKNLAMRDFSKLADLDTSGTVVKRVASDFEPPKGYEVVKYLDGGVTRSLMVNSEVAHAVTGLDVAQRDVVLGTILKKPASIMKAGATGLNVGFQISNAINDTFRNALMSKYGVRNPKDLIQFPLDLLSSVLSSVKGNLGMEDKLFKDYLESGAANATIASELRPEAFKRTLGIKEPLTLLNAPGRAASSVLDTAAKISNVIEETNKILGVKRGMRIEEIGKLPKDQAAQKMMEIASEVRNYAGSPDFARKGTLTPVLNLLLMFENARLQGVAADLSRLTGKTGTKEAVGSWAKLAAFVGVPTATIYFYNHSSPELEAQYAKLPQRDKENYFHIPKGTYIKDANGDMVMDYWRIPKKETMQFVSNVIEGGLKFAKDKDPEGLKDMAGTFIESILPVNIQGSNLTGRIQSLGSGLNPLIKVPGEYMDNKNWFYHSDTVPQSLQKARPENQYRPTTPDVYRILGKVTGQSPLKLQQMVGSITGGAINQLSPPKTVEGRSDVENNPLLSPFLNRFERSQRSDTGTFDQEFAQAQQKQSDATVDLRRRAEEKYAELSKLPKDEANAKAAEILKTDKALFDKIKSIKKETDAGITYQDRMVRELGIKSGVRAQFIYDHAMKAYQTKEERNAYIQDLYDKKIVTAEVLQQLKELKQKAGQ